MNNIPEWDKPTPQSDSLEKMNQRMCINEGWESILYPDSVTEKPLAVIQDEWVSVSIPHNWQDYHGYRNVSHGDLHGAARYRLTLPKSESALLYKDGRVQIYFQGVSSTAKVLMNGQLCGTHTGSFTGFTIDVTEAWDIGGENKLEVEIAHHAHMEDQPFTCGGCEGAPFAEGAQPFGIFRSVYLIKTGAVCFQPFGIYAWTDSIEQNEAKIRLRYECQNPSTEHQAATLAIRLIAPDGAEVREIRQACEMEKGQAIQEELALSIPDPVLWCPENPQVYTIEALLIDAQERIMDFISAPLGVRIFQWPEIAKPDAQHDVCSTRLERKLLSDGLDLPSDDNNGHTRIVKSGARSDVQSANNGIVIQGNFNHEQATVSASIELAVPLPKPVLIEAEVTNTLGTVFYAQCEMRIDELSDERVFSLPAIMLPRANIWSESEPFLYRLLIEIKDASDGALYERSETSFALIEGRKTLNVGLPVYEEEKCDEPIYDIPEDKRVFRINGSPFFVAGSASYENLLGNDYAWRDEQVKGFASMYASAGFNAFRDAHVPHHLTFYDEWDRRGIICWTQIESHLYHDNEGFRENMRNVVREWVRERRSHPCIFTWGLQNESILPEAFARELCAIMKEEDPTTGIQRLTTTCNGGVGADWNVPQEWSGTYGGNCNDFDLEVAQLVGEFGCWRVPGKHLDTDYQGDENDFSETWASFALGVKVSRAMSVAHKSMGFFHWPFHSFPNPGRSVERKEGEGNDAIGPVNSKGLLTSWLQPTSAYYMFQSAFSSPIENPMVFIVSHSWTDRWAEPGIKERILIYSNCESVELFNDRSQCSLGSRRNPGVGQPFRWDDVLIECGTLYAEASMNGKVVATDIIQMHPLPVGVGLQSQLDQQQDAWAPVSQDSLLINCGASSDYIDAQNLKWRADAPWSEGADFGYLSWSKDFDLEDPSLASVGTVYDPIGGTHRQALYKNFRYGMHRLRYKLPAQPGLYRISLGFLEPWYGIGSPRLDCSGWRIFDVAVNDEVCVSAHDIWASAGTLHADHVCFEYHNKNGLIEISFPRVQAGQALVSWIALERIVT